MIHRLAAELPTMWAAVLPIYGAPLQGQLKVPAALARVSILQVWLLCSLSQFRGYRVLLRTVCLLAPTLLFSPFSVAGGRCNNGQG